jgi:ankyrin repeat protein
MKTILYLFMLLACLAAVAISLAAFIFRDRRPAGERRLCRAVETGNTNYLQKYLNFGGNVNRPVHFNRFDPGTGPLLDMAIFNGQLGTIDFLLKNGANPNQQDSTGRTPLGWAIGSSRTQVSQDTRQQILKRLLQSGADLSLKISSQEGYTPLDEASFLGEDGMVKVLITAGANVNLTNDNGLTALNFAANAEVARLLIAAGADRTAHVGGETPAESAIRFGHLSALAVLTNAAAGSNAVGRK